MGLIETIENSALAIWVRESPSIFAYTTILSLHAMGLAIVVGLNLVIALRILGVTRELALPAMRKLFPWMYVGFTINALSGLSLLAANASNDLGNWMFLTKLTLILFAMVNLELTRAIVFQDGAGGGGATRALEQRGKPFAIAAIVLWALAIVAGRLTEYPNFVREWFGF